MVELKYINWYPWTDFRLLFVYLWEKRAYFWMFVGSKDVSAGIEIGQAVIQHNRFGLSISGDFHLSSISIKGWSSTLSGGNSPRVSIVIPREAIIETSWTNGQLVYYDIKPPMFLSVIGEIETISFQSICETKGFLSIDHYNWCTHTRDPHSSVDVRHRVDFSYRRSAGAKITTKDIIQI